MANSITEETIKELEALYRDGQYGQYRDLLLKNKDSFSKGQFHYNLGSLYAKKGDFGAARYNLEVAKNAGYGHPALYTNLSLVEGEISQGVNVRSDTLESVKIGVSGTSFSFLLTITLFLALIISVFYKIKVVRNKFSILVLLLISLVPVAAKLYVDKTYDVAVNIKSIEVYDGPSDIHEVIREVQSGQKLLLSKSFENWVYIAAPLQFSGWVKRSSVGYLKE